MSVNKYKLVPVISLSKEDAKVEAMNDEVMHILKNTRISPESKLAFYEELLNRIRGFRADHESVKKPAPVVVQSKPVMIQTKPIKVEPEDDVFAAMEDDTLSEDDTRTGVEIEDDTNTAVEEASFRSPKRKRRSDHSVPKTPGSTAPPQGKKKPPAPTVKQPATVAPKEKIPKSLPPKKNDPPKNAPLKNPPANSARGDARPSVHDRLYANAKTRQDRQKTQGGNGLIKKVKWPIFF